MSQEPTPTAGVFVGTEHQLPVRIYYEDTDFSGIVYHANYLRYFERGRSDFFRMIGVSHTELAAIDTAFAITRMEIDFKRAARVDVHRSCHLPGGRTGNPDRQTRAHGVERPNSTPTSRAWHRKRPRVARAASKRRTRAPFRARGARRQACLRSKNCSSSVEPLSAAVDASRSIVVVTRSK